MNLLNHLNENDKQIKQLHKKVNRLARRLRKSQAVRIYKGNKVKPTFSNWSSIFLHGSQGKIFLSGKDVMCTHPSELVSLGVGISSLFLDGEHSQQVESASILQQLDGTLDLSSTPNIKVLSLGGMSYAPDVSHLAQLSNLGVTYSDKITTIPSLASCSSLRQVVIGGVGYSTGSLMPKLTQLPDFPAQLRSLTIVGCTKITSLEKVQGLINLETLDVYNCHATMPPSLTGMVQLQYLGIHSSWLSKAPDVTRLTKLTWIDLSSNCITDAASIDNLFNTVHAQTTVTGGTIYFQGLPNINYGQNVPPTSASLAARNALLAAGWHILVNES